MAVIQHHIKCEKCHNIAVWFLLDVDGAFCDAHVPRGCDCQRIPLDGNWSSKRKKNWKFLIDEQGRKLPCVNFVYLPQGLLESNY